MVLQFAVLQESFLLRIACECYVVCLRGRARLFWFCPGKPITKVILISVLLYETFLCVVFLLNTFVMHFSALETEFSERCEKKKKHKRKKWWKQQKSWHGYLCLSACESWLLIVEDCCFFYHFLFRIRLAYKCATIQSKTDIKDNRVSNACMCVSVCERFSNNLNVFIYEKLKNSRIVIPLWLCSHFAVCLHCICEPFKIISSQK